MQGRTYTTNPLAKQFGPPFWSSDSAFIASDDSLNITKETLEDEILPEITVGKSKALQYLKEENVLFTNKGEDQKTWTVESENGVKIPRRFYSLSRDLLTPMIENADLLLVVGSDWDKCYGTGYARNNSVK